MLLLTLLSFAATLAMAQVCPAISFTHAMTENGISFQPLAGEIPDWVEVHFRHNGGIQQNVRMARTETYLWTFPIFMREGDRCEYFFTYCLQGIDCDTNTFVYIYETPVQEAFNPQPRVASMEVPVDTVLYVGHPQPVKPAAHRLPAPSWGGGFAAPYIANTWGGASVQPFQHVELPSWGGHHQNRLTYMPLNEIEPFQQYQAFEAPSWGAHHGATPLIEQRQSFIAANHHGGGSSWGGPVVEEPIPEAVVVQEELVEGNLYVAHAPPPKPAEPPSWGLHAIQPVVASQDFVPVAQSNSWSSWGGGVESIPLTPPDQFGGR